MLDFGYYNTDCMQGMAEFPDKYFELAIVDPPYGINIEKIWGNEKNGYKQYKKGGWDNEIPKKEYFDELFRVSKNQIIWGGNYFVKYLKGSMGWIFWDKGQRNFTCSDGELAYTSFEKALRVFTYSRSLSNFADIKIHLCQKPVALYTWLLNNYAKKGDKILDTHCGSASSLIACHKLGFDYVAFELDKDYYKASMERLKAVKNQISIFDKVEVENVNKKEQYIYDLAGGGEKGERAIRERREYLDRSDEELRQYGREKARMRYLPRKEKETVTMPFAEE